MTDAPHSPITRVRHVGLGVPNYAEALDFYRNIWGLEVVTETADTAFLATAADPEQYVLRLRRDEIKRQDLIAFAAESTGAVDDLADRLGRSGVTVVREPGALDTPGGGYGMRFFDLDGRLLEVSADVAEKPARPLERYESIPQKLSHVVINSPSMLATKKFYEDHLGFRLTDWLGEVMCFMRVRSDHHVLAIAQGPYASINHISFEMRGIDEFMRGTGRLIRAGYPQLWGPGRHSAGDNTFTYFTDRTGNVVEYTTELEEVDDDWVPRRFDTTPEVADQWGTAQGSIETIIPAMQNSRDDGLWTAPPI